MGARGPAPKPKLTVVREGNPGKVAKSKLDAQVLLPPAAPAEPKWDEVFPGSSVQAKRCRSTAQRAWRGVVPVLDAQGLLASVDLGALADLAVCQARLLECELDISANGLSQEGERGVQKNPAVTAANQYRTQLRWLWGQLYLTPAARARAMNGGGDNGDPDDPFD